MVAKNSQLFVSTNSSVILFMGISTTPRLKAAGDCKGKLVDKGAYAVVMTV
jgi:hypothetical protein